MSVALELQKSHRSKRMFDDTDDLAGLKGLNPRLLSGYLFAHNLAFAIVR